MQVFELACSIGPFGFPSKLCKNVMQSKMDRAIQCKTETHGHLKNIIFKNQVVFIVPRLSSDNQWWILDEANEANEAVAPGPPSKIAHTVLNPLQTFVQRTILSEDLFF